MICSKCSFALILNGPSFARSCSSTFYFSKSFMNFSIMEALYMPFLAAVLAAASSILLVTALSNVFRSAKSFNYPFIGMEDGNVNHSKARFVQEAD